MIINLAEPMTLPEEFVNKLKSISGLCKEQEFSDGLVENRLVSGIVHDINLFCEENRVLGFHYTRANPDSIRKYGLLSRTGDEIRAQFLDEYSYIFTKEEISELISRWNNYFADGQKKTETL